MHIGIGAYHPADLSFVFKRNFLRSERRCANSPFTSLTAPAIHGRPTVKFVSFVLDTRSKRGRHLQQQGIHYRHAKLCSFVTPPIPARLGALRHRPILLPADEKFTSTLTSMTNSKRRFGAPETCPAYVLAHELGHHLQKLIGVEQKSAR